MRDEGQFDEEKNDSGDQEDDQVGQIDKEDKPDAKEKKPETAAQNEDETAPVSLEALTQPAIKFVPIAAEVIAKMKVTEL